jgi:hypothetical protein
MRVVRLLLFLVVNLFDLLPRLPCFILVASGQQQQSQSRYPYPGKAGSAKVLDRGFAGR